MAHSYALSLLQGVGSVLGGWHAHSMADASTALQEGQQAVLRGRMQGQWLLQSWLEQRRGPWPHLRAQRRYTALCLLACPQALLHSHMSLVLHRAALNRKINQQRAATGNLG